MAGWLDEHVRLVLRDPTFAGEAVPRRGRRRRSWRTAAHPDVARYQSWRDFTLAEGRALVESMQGLRPGVPGQWNQFALEEARRTPPSSATSSPSRPSADEPREAEVGFTLAPAHQGKGYAHRSAPGACSGYAFGTLGLHRTIAVTDALNLPAAALLERVGMRREAHFHENVFFKGAWGSEFVFAMLEHEWSG